ncbi:MAG: asparagine synthase-related protein [Candidatus Latescibacterota bacterium]
MPGLAGFTSLIPLSPKQLDTQLQAIKCNLIAPPGAKEHNILFGPQTAGTFIGTQPHTKTYQNKTGIIAWLEGNLFNVTNLCKQRNLPQHTDLELLVAIAINPDYKNILKNIDGLFSAVVLDTNQNQLHIFTDRYGLRPLYWHQNPNGLFWASEPKAFLNLPHFSPKITAETATFFLETGQLPPNHTWFEGVTQVPPASHIIYNTTNGNLTKERYWWWDQLSLRLDCRNKDDLIQEFGHLFQAAVAQQSQVDKPGLLLSGGLDSRAVFAALPGSPHTFTFGLPNSNDVRIATDVAAVKMSPHTVFPLSQDNWLTPRMEATWWTDGALNLMHMHGAEHLTQIVKEINVCFNGAGGDGLAGGGHLFESHKLNHYLSQNLHMHLDNAPTIRHHIEKAFQNARSAHAFYIDWRMRGFSIMGPRMGLFKGVDYRLPFLDNQLQEFLFGLPLEIKNNNSLYRQMLINTYPVYFQDIPWAKTGKPITWSKWAIRSAKFFQKLKKKTTTTSMTDYPNWLRDPAFQKVINTWVHTRTARFANFTSPEIFEHKWSEHLAGQDHSEMICRYLTLELYLRQVFDKQYRTETEIRAFINNKTS